MRLMSICALVAAIGAPASARAQAGGEFNQKCFGGSSTPEQTIAACTAVIKEGSVNRKDLGSAYKIRGNAYDDSGHYDRAIEDYGQVIAINPADGDVFNNRGATYGAQGRYDLAIVDYDKRSRSPPAMRWHSTTGASPRPGVDQLAEALIDCNESLRLRPGDANTLASRGFTYLKMGRLDEALADYAAEIQVGPGNAYSLYGAA